MKRFSIITAMFLLMGMLFGTQVMAQGRIDFRTNSAQQCANVTEDGFTATFSFSGIQASEISTEKGVFSNLTMDGTYPSGNVGDPSLPAAHQLVASQSLQSLYLRHPRSPSQPSAKPLWSLSLRQRLQELKRPHLSCPRSA